MTLKSDNELLRLVEIGLRVARRGMAAYACARSRHDYTQRQLLVLLVLRAYLKLTYRGLIGVLEISPPLCEALGLEQVPHYTTLQKFAAKPDVVALVQTLLPAILRELGGKVADASVVTVEDDAAMDSSGLCKTLASAHFLRRSRRGSVKGSGRYVKIAVMVLCATLLPCALTVGPGPRSDTGESGELLAQARAVVKPRRLFADRGFDAESAHVLCREVWGVESFIPPVVRTPDGSIKTPHRATMTDLPKDYGKRWAVETFFSALKRTTGSGLTARRDQTLFNEAALRVLAYAIRR